MFNRKDRKITLGDLAKDQFFAVVLDASSQFYGYVRKDKIYPAIKDGDSKDVVGGVGIDVDEAENVIVINNAWFEFLVNGKIDFSSDEGMYIDLSRFQERFNFSKYPPLESRKHAITDKNIHGDLVENETTFLRRDGQWVNLVCPRHLITDSEVHEGFEEGQTTFLRKDGQWANPDCPRHLITDSNIHEGFEEGGTTFLRQDGQWAMPEIEIPQPLVVIRPNEDVGIPLWMPYPSTPPTLYDKINEIVANDNNYIVPTIEEPPNALCLLIRPNGVQTTYYSSVFVLSSDWQEYYYDWALNPYTNDTWQKNDLRNNFISGVALGVNVCPAHFGFDDLELPNNVYISNVRVCVRAKYWEDIIYVSQMWIEVSYLPLGEGKVLVSSQDTQRDYLFPKIAVTSGIAKTKLNPGGNEQVQLSLLAHDVDKHNIGSARINFGTATIPVGYSGRLFYRTDERAIYYDTGTAWSEVISRKKWSIGITIDGADEVITIGSKGYREIPCNAKILGWTILASSSGSIQIDVKKTNYAQFPSGVSIAGTEKPRIVSGIKNQDLILTTWSTDLIAGDILEFVVESVSNITRVNLFIHMYIY